MDTTYIFCELKSRIFVPPEDGFSPAFEAFFLAGFLEEALKLSVMFMLVWRSRHFNEEMDGVVYAIVVAAGFAAIENVGYTIDATTYPYLLGLLEGTEGNYHQALFKIIAIRSVPGHMMFGAIIGYFIGKARFARHGRGGLLAIGFFLAFMLHGTWDYLIFIGRFSYYYIFVLGAISALIIIIMLKKTKYRKVNSALLRFIKRSITAAKSGAYSHSTIQGLNNMAIYTRYLKYLEGDERDDIARRIYNAFPEPLSDYVEGGRNGILERIAGINRELLEYKHRLDLSFTALFILTMILPSSLLIAVLTGLNLFW